MVSQPTTESAPSDRLALELEREKKRADFWERQSQAQGRDLQKALEEIKRLGGVPCV
jgi:hypothetical protein